MFKLFNPSRFLASVLFLAMAPQVAASDLYQWKPWNGENGFMITRYFGPGGVVIIPESIEGRPVLAIDNTLFIHRNHEITSVVIPNTVKFITGGTFASCTALTNVTLPENLAYLDSHTFNGCTSLSSVVIPTNVTSIGYSAFYNCLSLQRITIPGNVETVENDAFVGCTSLTEVLIEEGVKSLGRAVFASCTNLTRVEIPESVSSIGSEAFFNCQRLTKVVFPEGISSIRSFTFYNCSALQNFRIPNSVVSIGQGAFSGCASLDQLVFPEGLVSINERAFEDCSRLSNVLLPASATNIMEAPFAGCSSLTNIAVKAGNPSYSSVGGVLFDRFQTDLIQFPGGLPGNFSLPESVIKIEPGALERAAKVTSVAIPAGVTQIGHRAFFKMASLSNITVHPNNTAYASADGVLFDLWKHRLIQYPPARPGSYVMPSNVLNVDSEAFVDSTRLESVELPAPLVRLEENTFSTCSALTNITVHPRNAFFFSTDGVLFRLAPPNVILQFPRAKGGNYVVPEQAFIGFSSFSQCSNLGSIHLPKSLELFYADFFYGCTSLSNITIDPGNPHFSSRDGVLLDKSQSSLLRYPQAKAGSYHIPGTVSRIGGSAFTQCAALTSLIVPASVSDIASHSFFRCNSLRSIYMLGNAPQTSDFAGGASSKMNVYYLPGTLGWDLHSKQGIAIPWRETDDLDSDGLNNLQERIAGTDPSDRTSILAWETAARPADLSAEDLVPLQSGQAALYFQTIPAMTYEVQQQERLGGEWKAVAQIRATTTQKRFVLPNLSGAQFYRVRAVPL